MFELEARLSTLKLVLIYGLVIVGNCDIQEQKFDRSISHQIHQQLHQVQQQIKKTQIENYFIQSQISYKNKDYSYNISHNRQILIPSYSGQLFLELKHHCSINHSQNMHIIKVFSFQSHTNSYLAYLSLQQDNQVFTIINYQCQMISKVNLPIFDLITDRNLLPLSTLILVTQDYELFSCTENNNFTDCAKIAKIPQSPIFVSKYIGGFSRSKGKGKLEIFVVQQNGPIMVYDHNGNNKLGISFDSQSKIISVADHHPNPLLLTEEGWIYILQVAQYSVYVSLCKHPGLQVKRIICSYPYSSFFYLISERAALKYQIKPQNKDCLISRKVYNSETIIPQSLHFEEFMNSIYLDNIIFNLTSQSISKLSDCRYSQYLTFKGWKNQYQNGFIAMVCCYSQNQCSIQLLKYAKFEQQSKKTAIILTVGILLFLWGIFYFFRSVEPKVLYNEYNQQVLHEYEKHNTNFKEQMDNYLQKQKKSSSIAQRKNRQ